MSSKIMDREEPAIIFAGKDKSKGWMGRLVDWLVTSKGQAEVTKTGSRELMDPRLVNPVASMAAAAATFHYRMLGNSGQMEKPAAEKTGDGQGRKFSSRRVLEEQSAN